MGLSQTNLGDSLGLTFQQVQKYENGSSRIGAARLYDLTKILDVPVSYFYEDMPKELEFLPRQTKLPSDEELDIMHKRETLEVVRGYYRIENADVRVKLRKLLQAMADAL